MSRDRTGDGRNCITVPAHGPSFKLPGGHEWCGHQSHDGELAREGQTTRPPTTPWIAEQEPKAPGA